MGLDDLQGKLQMPQGNQSIVVLYSTTDPMQYVIYVYFEWTRICLNFLVPCNLKFNCDFFLFLQASDLLSYKGFEHYTVYK